jgi:hypothetical protein
MSAGVIVAIVVVLVILAVVAALASRVIARRSAERRNYGPEYDRLVEEVGARKANAEFDHRKQRVDGLDIKPLSSERRALYGNQWVVAQEAFIDNPAESVRTAGALVTAVAADRGYEVTDPAQLQSDLSVHYGSRLEGYRSALTLTERASNGATEQLRQALLDYRTMFRELAEIDDTDDETPATAAAGTSPAVTGSAVTPAAAVPVQADAPATSDAPAATEAADTHGHRVFWRRESRETSGAGTQP